MGPIGELAAWLRDAAFPDQQFRRMGESLIPSSSVLVLVVDPDAVDIVLPILEGVRGTVATSSLDAALVLPTSPEAKSGHAKPRRGVRRRGVV